MDTRFLQSFIHVVESGSIAEAARRLDLTPASVAQRLKALEASVGSKLVARSGRNVRPTVAGNRIMERARRLVDEVRDLKSAASGTDLPAGPLRLGATPTALTGIVPTVLKQWVARHPDIEIYIDPGSTVRLYSRVLAGELDAAVLVHPLFDLPKGYAWRPLREEPLILLTRHDVAGRDALAIAAREPFIRYDRSVVGGRLADDYLRERGVRPRVRFELDGIESIAKLVSEGLGVSVLPDWPVIGRADPALKKWTLPAPRPTRTVGVLWQPSAVRAQLVEAFVQLALGGKRRRSA
ncbi:LysR family transcriptional regulator [Achromobacter aloeverae]|uniref:LysR family transcriptional regulator n=1 Tax=Achromobacter aloeverae TaxID=1750518 RepID=A0A4Q1HQP1_9BURK|nr:LysR family transcriptional regulator [Achromobacter aloeverae]RXN93011.1 LysR family transcriptional regulator [Achromobacter aloeverae]